MAQPTPYTPEADFSAEEADNVGGRSTMRTAAMDAELAAIKLTLDGILANLALNQRDDGNIRDLRVKLFTLGADVRAFLAATGGAPRGAWTTGVTYALRDLVTQGGSTYICAVAHTAGTFATDLAAVRWLLLALDAGTVAAGIPFSSTATIAATNVQAAIEESDTETRALVGTLAADLANTVNPAKGAGLVGYSDSLTYPENTVGAKLNALAAGTGGGGSGGGGTPSTGETFVAGDSTGVASSNAAITTAQTASQNIAFAPGTYRVTANITITSAVRFLKGAKLLINNGVTVTINGPLNAGLWQVFSWAGTGKVVLGPSSVAITVPEWWGASPAATAGVNSATFQACVYASYGKEMWMLQGAYQTSGFSIPPLAEGGTSQLTFALIGRGADGNAGTGGCTLYWDGTGHCINMDNTFGTNSDTSMLIEGIHVVGTGAADPGTEPVQHHGLHAFRCNNLIVRRCQFTKCRQVGVYFEDCYGSSIENSTFLENGWYGIELYRRANIVRLSDIKAYRNGKVYDRITGNIYVHGGSGFESLGLILDNVDVSYSGNAATIYKKTGGTLTNITVSGGVATVNTSVPHGRTTGDQIAVIGCTTDDALNTTFTKTITVTSTTAFTFSTSVPNGTYTDSTLVVGPASYGLLMQNVQGARVYAYAEDCMGPALSMDPTVTETVVQGGYWQGVDFGCVILLDNPSNIDIGSAMRIQGPFAKLYFGTTLRRHQVNYRRSSCTLAGGAKLVESTALAMWDGVYVCSGNPGTSSFGGSGTVWQQGDYARARFAVAGSVTAYQCGTTGTGPTNWLSAGVFS